MLGSAIYTNEVAAGRGVSGREMVICGSWVSMLVWCFDVLGVQWGCRW